MSELQRYLATEPLIRETVVGYLVRDDEVLLGQRTRVSNNLGHMIVAGIGGGVEPGESPEQALEREMFEEIKVQAIEYQKVGYKINLTPFNPVWNLSVVIYLVTGFKGEPQKTEDIDPRWYPKNSLPLEDMWADNRITVPLVLNGKRFVGSFLHTGKGQIGEQHVRELTAGQDIPNNALDMMQLLRTT